MDIKHTGKEINQKKDRRGYYPRHRNKNYGKHKNKRRN